MKRYRICCNGRSIILTEKMITLSTGETVKSSIETSSLILQSLSGYDEVEIYEI